MHLLPRFALASVSLHTKLMLALLVLVATVAGASAYALFEQERNRRLVELGERATRIADLFSQSLALPLWNIDVSAIQSQLAALAPNPEVAEFTVTAERYGEVSSVKNVRQLRPGEAVVRIRPIEYGPPGNAPREKIGEIRVVLTKAVAQQAINRARQGILAIMAAVVVLLYAATFLLLKRMVRTPINRLEDVVDRIAGGDLNATCAVESDDELGRLAMRFNIMADRLRVSTLLLRESERKYRSIVENAVEGIFLLDQEGNLSEVNPAMAQLFGYDNAADLIKKNPDENPFNPCWTKTLFEMLRANGEILGLELQMSRLDGTPIWVQLNARGLVGDDGRLGYLEGLMTDVTARKDALENLKRQRDQLELEVRERQRTELELLASREQLQRLSAHQEVIREEERKYIAMEIHDELGQLLTALKIDVSLLRMQLSTNAAAIHKANEMRELVDKTIRIVRNVVSNLRPTALNYGLASALEWLAADFSRHTQILCHFEAERPEPSLSDTRATAVFRIVQESLTNVARHANASRVDVTLAHTESGIELAIRDDGQGFDIVSARAGSSYGLQGMAERARLIDAELEIDSEPGCGAVIRLRIRQDSIDSR
ncbi:PAS domain S-box protein [Cupriavidus consociatus]|uniref:PAS domain S-box protein n=1 Tax=Cupriavidus consociatus TaxID=2821357 RepID=UPI001AE76688|nr:MULTISPECIES: PAS domain S-box protein [unclassified Cupriavidus]MBP0625158.1 PAS domain S-box protein [Cupriavidus sp. LEh25]MDK2661899.1 PAS domain S-box protein [Cupriavidus sp. LEh21]